MGAETGETLPPGVILAGGTALRMGGGDKALLALGGRTLLARVIARLRPQVGALAVNANGDPARFADAGLPVIPDAAAEPTSQGPLAGVLAGLDWAAKIGAATIVTAAADTPFLPADLVLRLQAVAAETGAPIVLAATPEGADLRAHPTFGLWPVALREDLRLALRLGERRMNAWAGGHGAARAAFPAAGVDPFFNINTPQDLAAAERLLESAQA